MAKEDFDFFSELNGREIFHYNGGPVYVEDFHQGNTCDVRTMSGQILKNVPVDELESPEPEDMDYV